MCITKQEVADVVDQRLKLNNEERDKNLQKKLEEQTEKLFAHTSKLLQHPIPSLKTTEELTSIKQNCFTRGVELKQMNERLDEIVEKQNKQDEKLDKILENMDKTYAAKWVERSMIAFISLLVLAALYTILESAGLKH